MEKKKTQQDYTKNIFKNDDDPDKRQFSQKWKDLTSIQPICEALEENIIIE